MRSIAEAHAALAATVRALPPSRLDALVAGRDHDVATMLHGVVEHAAYHGGQVAILRRALGIAS